MNGKYMQRIGVHAGATFLSIALALTGCGGGSKVTPVTAPASDALPAPTVTLSVNQSKLSLGQSAKLTWSTTNATSCTATGAWSGIQTTAGTASQTPAASGPYTYILTCTGSAGTATGTAMLTVPIPVQKSSYLNAKNTGMPAQSLPASNGANPVKFIAPTEQITAGYAFGDFFQDGSYSMVGFSNNFLPPNDPNYEKSPGHAYFYKKDAKGNWIDHTAELLTDQTGCITPRKAIVADFNGDGVPDVFVACHGTDLIPVPVGYAVGEVPRILLSQSDGTYKNTAAPINCYCHGAAAADVNGNGYADIVVTDPSVRGKPIYLVNRKDGTFIPDESRMPASTAPNSRMCDPACPLNIWSVELVDFSGTGKFDLWLGGSDNDSLNGFASRIYHNPGSNNFRSASATVLPASDVIADSSPIDLIYLNGNIYLMRVDAGYSQTSIQKIKYPSLESSTIYRVGKISGTAYTWFIWMLPYQTYIVSADASYGVSVPQ